MSLEEIKNAVSELNPQELAELAAFIREQDNLAWDREVETDFSPGGEHYSSRHLDSKRRAAFTPVR